MTNRGLLRVGPLHSTGRWPLVTSHKSRAASHKSPLTCRRPLATCRFPRITNHESQLTFFPRSPGTGHWSLSTNQESQVTNRVSRPLCLPSLGTGRFPRIRNHKSRTASHGHCVSRHSPLVTRHFPHLCYNLLLQISQETLSICLLKSPTFTPARSLTRAAILPSRPTSFLSPALLAAPLFLRARPPASTKPLNFAMAISPSTLARASSKPSPTSIPRSPKRSPVPT